MMGKPATISENAAGALRDAAFNAERDMLAVYDFALILHDYMSDAGGLDAERRGALCHLTCALVEHGLRLKEHHAAMFAVIHPEP
jgi:hypothetical protein